MNYNRCLDDLDPNFVYKNANDSHSWLINYPGKLRPDSKTLQISSMRETFQAPELHRDSSKGKRKKLMEAFYRQIISEEVFRQYDSEDIIIENYETNYMEHFKNPEDMPLPGETCSKNEKLKLKGETHTKEHTIKSELEELKTKYPLYQSAPLTFVSQITGRENFRKNTTITKSPDKNYDNIEY